jgi:hypothetical protein
MKEKNVTYLSPAMRIVVLNTEAILAVSGENEGLVESGYDYGDSDFE